MAKRNHRIAFCDLESPGCGQKCVNPLEFLFFAKGKKGAGERGINREEKRERGRGGGGERKLGGSSQSQRKKVTVTFCERCKLGAFRVDKTRKW